MSPELLLELPEEVQIAFAKQREENASLAAELAQVKAQLAWLNKQVFGPKSEKNVIPGPPPSAQPDIFGSQGEATPAEIEEEAKKPTKDRGRKPAGRKPLPKNLPRTRIEHDVPEEEKTCKCCGKPMCLIGEDVTEKLGFIPAQLFVEEHVRPRYGCGSCKDGIVQAPLPDFPIPRASASASLLAYLMISKYADHLPLCRMERIFARHGIDLPRSKTCDWMMGIADLLSPLVALMKRRIIERSAIIGADETTIKMIGRDKEDDEVGKRKKKQKKKIKTCFLWEYRGDDLAPYTIFDFQDGRGRAGPEEVLRNYGGFLQSDAYVVYKNLRKNVNFHFKPVGCWAHARRKFVDAFQRGEKLAEEVVLIIGELYAVEKEARERKLDAEATLKLRQEKSVPVLAKLREWMDANILHTALPNSLLGNAIGYVLDNWSELSVFTTDGHIPIDNNAVERAIRPVALGRKNWLFAGSERGGEAAAIFFSLIDSARRADANLWEYMTDLLTRIPSHPINRLEELLPDNWKRERN